MAGGTFSSMNKVRPGAYINFTVDKDAVINIGERGIATMAMALNWGTLGELIELTADEFVSGNTLAKIGLLNTDSAALPLKLAFENCSKVILYNTSGTGAKATKTLTDGLTITAKYYGTFGNKIAILIKAADTLFTVETYADGYFVDSQTVAGISDLVSNDYVDFSGTGTLAVTESTLLTGGTTGNEVSSATYLPLYFNLLKGTRFNALAILTTSATDISTAITFAQTMRTTEGKYIQVVVANAASADYEGVINNVNGIVTTDGTNIPANTFTAWVAGAVAGAKMTESLTGKIVNNASSIINSLSNTAIETGLKNGKFILSLNQNGTIKVEKDINSLHTFTDEKSYLFSKNRVIRELDGIASAVQDIWELTFLGKVSNNEDGRMLFKSSIINYLNDLQNQGAIEEFNKDLVIVEAGDDVDSVIASIAVKPVDSMEFLYMTINVVK